MTDLTAMLDISSARHRHLCPRQVLGVRIGLAGASALGLETYRTDKRLLVILETDGCFADGIEAATGCTVGHRTLRVADYGKIAATFVDTRTETAVRVAPQLDIRVQSRCFAPEESKQYFAQLVGYQRMPVEQLLTVQTVTLTTSARWLVSRAGVRVNCSMCGEEIINECEVIQDGQILCQACAGPAYYAAESLVPFNNLLNMNVED
ncbi:MAG: FmdE family protein [Chloroflexota bacterium]